MLSSVKIIPAEQGVAHTMTLNKAINETEYLAPEQEEAELLL